MPYLFVPPVEDEGPMGGNWLFARYTRKQGVTVYRLDGQFYEDRFPAQDDLVNADLVYLGGHEYILSDAEAQVLINLNAGYDISLITS
jgi:hypothetical protein